MPLTYQIIKEEVVNNGLTITDVFDKYSKSKRTYDNVDNELFVDYLADELLLYTDLDGEQRGLLTDALLGIPPEITAKTLRGFSRRLRERRFKTSKDEHAAILQDVLAALPKPGDTNPANTIKADFRNFVRTNGSTFFYKDVVDEPYVQAMYDAGVAQDQAVADAEAAAEAERQRRLPIEALFNMILSTWIDPALADGTSTAAQVQAAIKAGL